MALAGAVRAQIKSVDPDQPAFRMLTLEQQLKDSLAPRRAALMLFGAFSVSALLLALVGIYGVVAYSISLRAQEIGIRMALGGQRADILRLVLRQGLGMMVGAAMLACLRPALWASRVDPMTALRCE